MDIMNLLVGAKVAVCDGPKTADSEAVVRPNQTQTVKEINP